MTENYNNIRNSVMPPADRVSMLEDTLSICEQGYYMLDGRKVDLKLSLEEMKKVHVFLPDEVEGFAYYKKFEHIHVPERCKYGCENMDSFSLARKRYEDYKDTFAGENAKEILVLNLANPVNPGGGVRRGARAQEEDLCRKSSLLLSLESEDASLYYMYNRYLRTYMGSDAIIITPKVEIIKDEDGNLLEDSVIVSVMTCAAYLGYKNLVLGAFGCGAFDNDARIVSALFYKALKEFDFDGMKEHDMFRSIDFAVLSRGPRQYNFREFYRYFGGDNFYREEKDAQ